MYILGVLLSSFLVVGCSQSKETTKESSHISSTEIFTSTKETKQSTTDSTLISSSESSKSPTDNSSSNISKDTNESVSKQNIKPAENSSYQAILDDYSAKLIAAAPILVNEYNSEYPNVTNGVEGLAELSNQKVSSLAEIVNQGTGEMADFMWSTGSEYNEYESWAGKLYDVYSTEAGKITDAYFDSAMGEVPTYEEFSTPEPYYEEPAQSVGTDNYVAPPASSQEAVQPQQPAEEYLTLQPGEGPQELASRAGISLEQLFQLNGMDPNNFMMAPGDSFRVK